MVGVGLEVCVWNIGGDDQRRRILLHVQGAMRAISLGLQGPLPRLRKRGSDKDWQ